MPTEYKRRELGGGVTVFSVADPKFKSNTVTVRFRTEYRLDDAAALAIIPAVLTSCCSRFPDGLSLSKKLNSLYGAVVAGSSDQKGDAYEIAFCVDYLDDRYALEGEKISQEAVSLLMDCIFDPALDNDGFLKSEFEIRRADLLDAIDGEINDKASYALNRAYETVYDGEPTANKYYGSRKAVEELTPKKAFEVYKRLLKEASVEISICGCADLKTIEPLINRFDTKRSDRTAPKLVSFSPAKKEPAYVSENASTAQANLVMAFKPEHFDRPCVSLLSKIYGEAPFSKLFVNVREKMSLCYYCSSACSEAKGTLFVISAMDNGNVETVINECVNQLSAIANGDFSDEDLAQAKLLMTSRLKAVEDRVSSAENWYSITYARGEDMSPGEYIDVINSVKREDIISLAREMKLDTVFVLKKAGDGDEE